LGCDGHPKHLVDLLEDCLVAITVFVHGTDHEIGELGRVRRQRYGDGEFVGGEVIRQIWHWVDTARDEHVEGQAPLAARDPSAVLASNIAVFNDECRHVRFAPRQKPVVELGGLGAIVGDE
jgi:hypothetical protein